MLGFELQSQYDYKEFVITEGKMSNMMLKNKRMQNYICSMVTKVYLEKRLGVYKSKCN